jgi:hypothetical protein
MGLLEYDANPPPPEILVGGHPSGYRASVRPDFAACRADQTGKDMEKCALARPCDAGDQGDPARGERTGDLIQYGLFSTAEL